MAAPQRARGTGIQAEAETAPQRQTDTETETSRDGQTPPEPQSPREKPAREAETGRQQPEMQVREAEWAGSQEAPPPRSYLHEVLPLAGGPQGGREAAAGLLVPGLCAQTRGCCEPGLCLA